jgi:diguanylate cyclase (GGDEF)-like protein
MFNSRLQPPSIFHKYQDGKITSYGWTPENDTALSKIIRLYSTNPNSSFPQFTKDDYDYALKELMTHIEELNNAAWLDDATKLLNAHAFNKEMKAIVFPRIKALHNGDTDIGNTDKYPPVTVAKIDMNYLKAYNDFSYFNGGNAALKNLAGFVSRYLKKNEKGQLIDTFVRYGGDEFFLVMRGCDKKTADARLKEISEAIASESLHGEEPCVGISKDGEELNLQVSMSYGCAQLDLSNFEITFDKDEDMAKVIQNCKGVASDEESKNKAESKKYAASIEDGIPYSEDREKSLKIVEKNLKERIEKKQNSHATRIKSSEETGWSKNK